MFPLKNRPPVQPSRQFDPFSFQPSRSMYPIPKPKTSIPASIASYLNPSKEGGGLTKTLSNVQQVMNMVESAGPMMKEYGPMVKNLPAMIKMMKALNESDETKNESEVPNKTKEESPKSNDEPTKETIRENKSRSSKPKLFI